MTILPGHTFGRFIAAGMANTALGLACIYSARALGLGEVSANATGYAVGFLLSYILNRQWVFQQRESALPHLLRFAAVLPLAWLINLATLLELMSWGASAAVAQAGAALSYTLTSYLGCRHWVFAHQPKRREEEKK